MQHEMAQIVARPGDLAISKKIQGWEGLIDHLPIGICVCDRAGALVRHNRRAAELWGRAPEPANDPKRLFSGAVHGYEPDGKRLLSESPVTEALRTGKTVRDREVVLFHPDGTRVSVLANVEPLFDDDGEIIGAVTCFQDITELRRIEDLQRQHERQFRDVLQALPGAVYTIDAAGRITFYNEAAADLWGCRPEIGTDSWCGSWKLYSPEGIPLAHDECPMALALKEERAIAGAEAVAERPDGTRVPFLAYPTPLHDGSGAVCGAVNMLVDISERKRAELHQKTLLDELNHRVKNTLATVQSLAGHTIRKSGLPPEVRADFEGRLIALSRAHDQLTRAHWEAADLKKIVEDTFEPFRGGSEALQISGERIRLGAQAALTLSMIFHELATNAAKYGALSSPNGRLAVSWTVANGHRPPTLCINWQETGGPVVKRPDRIGFGSRLVERGITHQLHGSAKLDYDPAGLRCTMEIPLASTPG